MASRAAFVALLLFSATSSLRCAKTVINGLEVHEPTYEKISAILLGQAKDMLHCEGLLQATLLEVESAQPTRVAVAGCTSDVVFQYCSDELARCPYGTWYAESVNRYPEIPDPEPLPPFEPINAPPDQEQGSGQSEGGKAPQKGGKKASKKASKTSDKTGDKKSEKKSKEAPDRGPAEQAPQPQPQESAPNSEPEKPADAAPESTEEAADSE